MDVYHAAAAVQLLPEDQREDACQNLIWQAHIADKYLKRLRKIHPCWGDGSLRMAALKAFSGERHRCISPDHLACLALVARVLAARSRGHKCR